MILVRHASAGDRDAWEGDDAERPLDRRGAREARELVARLAGRRIDAIYTSPAKRCVDTVTPLATALRVDVLRRDELAEPRMWTHGHALVRSLAADDVLVCGHGGLEQALVDAPKWPKGAAFAVTPDLRVDAVL